MDFTDEQYTRLMSAERMPEFSICLHGVQVGHVDTFAGTAHVIRIIGHTTVLNPDAVTVPDDHLVAIDIATDGHGVKEIIAELSTDMIAARPRNGLPVDEILRRLIKGNQP